MSANVILHRKQTLRGVFLLRLFLFWVEHYVSLMSYWPSRQIFMFPCARFSIEFLIEFNLQCNSVWFVFKHTDGNSGPRFMQPCSHCFTLSRVHFACFTIVSFALCFKMRSKCDILTQISRPISKQPFYVIVCLLLSFYLLRSLSLSLCFVSRASIIHLSLFVSMVPQRTRLYTPLYTLDIGVCVCVCVTKEMDLLMCKHSTLFIQFLSSFIWNSGVCFRL